MRSASIGPIPRSAQRCKTWSLAKFISFGADGDSMSRPFRLYCTSFPHLLQLSICSIEPLLFPGRIAGPACPRSARTHARLSGRCPLCRRWPSEVCKALPGLPELHGTGGGVSPGGVLGQIPAFPLADGPLPGALHLADLVAGVEPAVVLDVPGVEGFKAFLRPCGRAAQLGNTTKKVWRQFQPQSPAPVP